jgi:hypothetical protein
VKRALAPFCYLSVSRFLLTSTVVLAAAFTTGCGSGPTGPVLSGNTSVTVLLTSTANDQLSEFYIDFTSITLTSQSGKTVNLFTTPQKAEFIHLNGTAEPLVTVSIPQDIYTAASATIQGAGFTCVHLLPTGSLQTSAFGPNGALTPTLMLPSPITVTGTAMGLLLNLQVRQSAMFSSCDLQDAIYSLTPTFNLTPVALASPPPRTSKTASSLILKDKLLPSIAPETASMCYPLMAPVGSLSPTAARYIRASRAFLRLSPACQWIWMR